MQSHARSIAAATALLACLLTMPVATQTAPKKLLFLTHAGLYNIRASSWPKRS